MRKVRKAFLKSLATAFFVHERIRTTEARAKELRPFVEKLITQGKADTLSEKRLIAKILPVHAAKNIEKIAAQMKERKGGYSRIIFLGRRKSDGAKMVILELAK